MTTETHDNTTDASKAYAALRHGGESAARVQTRLGLKPGRAAWLERQFQRRAGLGGLEEAVRPRFAHHDAHVAAVEAAGGYPTLRVVR